MPKSPTPDLEYIEDDIAKLQNDVEMLQTRVSVVEDGYVELDRRVTALESGAVEQPPTEPPVEQPPPDEDDSLQDIVNAGGEVTLPADHYTEYCTVTKGCQITGQPTTIDVSGMTISNGKGIFDAQADLEVSKLTLKGASVPSANGAGIRGAIGANITMYDCTVTECQMGILVSGGADIVIDRCTFTNNGTGGTPGGLGHEVYCSGESRQQYGDTNFTMTDSQIIGGPKTCISLKVRATHTTVRGCEIRGTTNTNGSSAGRVVDLPDGGEVEITDCEIELMSQSPTGSILGYCTENTNQGAGTVTLRNVKVIDSRGRGGEFWAREGVGCRLVLENVTYTAPNPPSLYGWASVQGQFTKA